MCNGHMHLYCVCITENVNGLLQGKEFGVSLSEQSLKVANVLGTDLDAAFNDNTSKSK